MARARSLWQGTRERDRVEAEMAEEFEHHIEMHAEHLEQQGVPPEEARRQARLDFGFVESTKAEARASRGLEGIDEMRFSWLDLKTGVRMLGKSPGLTLVAVFALAIGIPVGLAPSHLAQVVRAPLPEDPENRVRSLRYWNQRSTLLEEPTGWELDRWSAQLTSFETLGAARMALYNVGFSSTGGTSTDGAARWESFSGAEITASAFDLLGTRPLLGRTFDPTDHVLGSPHVVLVGHDLWQSHLGSDADVVDRTLWVGGVPHTVIGVLPRGFAFPMRQRLWLPMRDQPAARPGTGRELHLFGRLAPGATDATAQAELDAISQQLQAEYPETHTDLVAEVVPFPMGFLNLSRSGLQSEPGFYAFQVLGLILLVVACTNVAMLIFARAATRTRELAVRSALGASRARVITQMFAESAVLTAFAAGLGLVLAEWSLGRIFAFAVQSGATLPYWLDLGVTTRVVLWTLALGGLSAMIAGVAPAWSITQAPLVGHLGSAGSGGHAARFGRLSGALIAADVAIAVVVVVVAAGMSHRLVEAWGASDAVPLPAHELLSAEIRIPPPASADAKGVDAASARMHRRLLERLAEEPGVRAATAASALPRMDHPVRRVEVEGLELDPPGDARDEMGDDELRAWHRVRTSRVDLGYFDALEQNVLSGRSFGSADLEKSATSVLVDTLFVEHVLAGRGAVGHRIRFVPRRWSSLDEPTPWYEIVGVVPALGLNVVRPDGDPGVYLPAAPGTLQPFRVAVHTFGDPAGFAPRLRELLQEVEPRALLLDPKPLHRTVPRDWYFLAAVAGGLFLLVGILVALAASAVFAMITFTVAQRTREIGVRGALGAPRAAIIFLVLRRTTWQLLAGTAVGLPLAFGAVRQGFGLSGWGLAGLVSTGLVVIALVAALACTLPTLRALQIEPTSALRED